MEPESPGNERQRKIDEAIESGNHELREMARLAYNRGDKGLARNIWRSLTEAQGDEPTATGASQVQSSPVPPSVVADPDLEAARRAEEASQNAGFGSTLAVYAGTESTSVDGNVVGPADAVTGSDAMTSADAAGSGGSAAPINPAPPGSKLL